MHMPTSEKRGAPGRLRTRAAAPRSTIAAVDWTRILPRRAFAAAKRREKYPVARLCFRLPENEWAHCRSALVDPLKLEINWVKYRHKRSAPLAYSNDKRMSANRPRRRTS